MKILVVAGYCLRVNSSANLCHLSYLNGVLDCGHTVDLLTVSEKNQIIDPGIALPPVRKVFAYDASWYEQMSNRRHLDHPADAAPVASAPTQPAAPAGSKSLPSRLKARFRAAYGPHRMSIIWYHRAKRFFSKERYDLVISLADPPVSHKLVGWLLDKKRLRADHWLQIWEDPWGADINGYTTLESIRREEDRLLKRAEQVMYVSPLTLLYQQQAFPAYADKMSWMPLPAYYQSEELSQDFSRLSFGYFGDYVSHVRDLRPFYETAVAMGLDTTICGNSDQSFPSTDAVQVYPRLPLGELKHHEDRANVLVFLCNRGGGQIPGKLYQYAATNKLVLFIMDGNPMEQKVLREYFEGFGRFVFCENNRESIAAAVRTLQTEPIGSALHTPLSRFTPKQIISEIIEGATQ